MGDYINALQTQTRGPNDMLDDASLRAILTNKAPMLSNPGSVVSNDLYYDASSSVVKLAESVQNYGRYSQSLNSLQFGSVSSITIPNSSFLSGLYLYLEIPALPFGCYLPRGWGLNLINQISFILGSSNVSQLSLSGQSHAQMAILGCETAEKRDAFLRLCGEEVTTEQPPGTINRAYVQLQLPWSRICALNKKLPFDTNILNSPIIIQLQTKQKAEIFTGSGIFNAPNQLQAGRVLANQIDLEDKSFSLRLSMMKDASLIYSYPYIFTQSLVQEINGSNVDVQNYVLNGLINADLVGISFSVLRKDRATSGVNGANALSPFCYDKVQDVQLTYNGLVLYDAPGRMCELYDLQDSVGNGVMPMSCLTAGGAGPFVTFPFNAYVHYISLQRIKNTQFLDYFQNSIRIANNALNLGFRTPENTNYYLYITYFYNACFTVNQGTSSLVIS